MSQNRSFIQRYAMLYGTYMGVFWILKFILLPLAPAVPFFMFLFVGLTLAVPFMSFYYARLYRNEVCGGSISFGQAWIFTLFMYVFAAMLTTVAHYIYFQFIDHGHLLAFFLDSFKQAAKLYPEEMQADLELIKESTQTFFEQPAINITVQFMANNVYYGSLLAIPTALFVMRKRKPTATPTENNNQ